MLIVTALPILSRAAWIEDRRQDITASEVAALFGRSKYCSALQVAHAKLYGEPDQKRDGVLRRGHILEPACAAAVEHDHGLQLVKVRHYLRGRDPANACVKVGATLDYEHDGDGRDLLRALDKARVPHTWGELDGLPVRINFEHKAVDRDIFEDEWSDGPPAQFIYQALMQSMLGGYDGAIIAALVVNYAHDLHLYTVPRDEALEAKMLAAVAAFWDDLDQGVLPAAEARDNSTIAKATRPRTGDTSVVDLRGDPTWEILLEDRERLKAKAKAVDYELDAVEVRLKEAMGDCVIALIDGWSVSWKPNTKGVRSLKIDRK